jgi:hypothetical protein
VLPDGSSRLVYTRGADGFLMEILITSAGVWGAPAVKVSSASFNTSLSVLPDGSSRLVYTRGADGFLMEVLTTDAYSAIPIKDDYAFVGSGIVEVGQNTNGTYIMFGDGTMVCIKDHVAITSAGLYWTFPSPFIDTSFSFVPSPVGNAAVTGYVRLWEDSTKTASVIRIALQVYAGAGTGYTDLITMGRWK